MPPDLLPPPFNRVFPHANKFVLNRWTAMVMLVDQQVQLPHMFPIQFDKSAQPGVSWPEAILQLMNPVNGFVTKATGDLTLLCDIFAETQPVRKLVVLLKNPIGDPVLASQVVVVVVEMFSFILKAGKTALLNRIPDLVFRDEIPV